jgi:outer membrane lipoprotein SlyB
VSVLRPTWIVALLALAFSTMAGAQGLGSGCDNCGTVLSITPVDTSQAWAPLGMVVPPTVSAPVSGMQPGEVSTQYQIGKDGMNKGMVLLGSAGGAVYRERPETVTQRRWQVTVKMDQGDQRVLLQSYEPALHEGDRVHVYGTQLDLIQP